MTPDLLSGKLSHSEIAAKHGTSKTTVQRASAAIRSEVLDEQAAALVKIRAGLAKAVDRVLDLLDSGDHKVALAAANSIMDRAGIVKSERREVTGAGGAPVTLTAVVMTAEERERFARKGEA
jgi:hypothetical protein